MRENARGTLLRDGAKNASDFCFGVVAKTND